MIKIKYNGDISPTRVWVGASELYFRTGEIKEVTEGQAKILLTNPVFQKIDKVPTEKDRLLALNKGEQVKLLKDLGYYTI